VCVGTLRDVCERCVHVSNQLQCQYLVLSMEIGHFFCCKVLVALMQNACDQ
jgi:hypothetical protein